MGSHKPPECTLPLAEPTPEVFVEAKRQEMLIWMKSRNYKGQEEKKLLRGYQEKIFNGTLELQADIGKEEKKGTRDDYVRTLWEGVLIDKNITNKGVTLPLQKKRALSRSILGLAQR